jgi:hypothetical protein
MRPMAPSVPANSSGGGRPACSESGRRITNEPWRKRLTKVPVWYSPTTWERTCARLDGGWTLAKELQAAGSSRWRAQLGVRQGVCSRGCGARTPRGGGQAREVVWLADVYRTCAWTRQAVASYMPSVRSSRARWFVASSWLATLALAEARACRTFSLARSSSVVDSAFRRTMYTLDMLSPAMYVSSSSACKQAWSKECRRTHRRTCAQLPRRIPRCSCSAACWLRSKRRGPRRHAHCAMHTPDALCALRVTSTHLHGRRPAGAVVRGAVLQHALSGGSSSKQGQGTDFGYPSPLPRAIHLPAAAAVEGNQERIRVFAFHAHLFIVVRQQADGAHEVAHHHQVAPDSHTYTDMRHACRVKHSRAHPRTHC